MSVDLILMYSRPWEFQFHKKLAARLRDEFPRTPLKFVTFFHEVHDRCITENIECIYLPRLLKQSKGCSDAELAAVDEEVFVGFDSSLNVLLNGERFLPNGYSEKDIFLKNHVDVISKIVMPNTLSISSMYDHFAYCLAGALANARGGRHYAFVGCGVPGGRVLGLRTPSEAWQLGSKEDWDLAKLGAEILTQKSSKRIEYMQSAEKKSIKFHEVICALKRRARARKSAIFDCKEGGYFPVGTKSLTNTVLDKFSLAFRKKGAPPFCLDNINELEAKKGIFVALHMEPEATLLMYSPWLRNQVEFVRLLSVCSPIGTMIYVKENPKMIGVRDVSYYTQLSEIPNVILVSDEIESSELISKTSITASVCGTVTIEAFLLGKPTITLGKAPFKSMVDFCIYDRGISEIREFIDNTYRNLDAEVESENRLKLFQNWARLSFKAKSVPLYSFEGGLQIPFDDANVEKYFSVVYECFRRSAKKT